MLKQASALFTTLLLAALPAGAQNASDIARIQAGGDCRDCNLFQAILAYRNLPGVDASGARLTQADLSLATLNGANFSGADLSMANLFGARLTGCDLSGANLERATLVGTYLGGANLADARLAGANLGGADLQTARGLTASQLAEACGDESTRLPSGLSLPRCG